MKIEMPKQNVNVCGDFPTSEFQIGDPAWIVDMFADKIYTNKYLAIIRELSCNAYDSHIVAGTTQKFKLHLPTYLEPWFEIRDFGTGLSEEEIRSVFAGIGISTKRDSNDFIGCFGIGSLSPYSLVDNFTVKSWFGGEEKVYSCYRDDQRNPVVSLLSCSDSDEPNGVEISFTPDSNHVYRFKEEAINVFKWWNDTPELNINIDTEIENFKSKFRSVSGVDFSFGTNYGNMYAIMGNIAYEVPEEMRPKNFKNYECFMHFDIGELNFDTGRESLVIDEKTKSAIFDRCMKVKNSVEQEIVKDIEKEPTRFLRAVKADELQNCNALSSLVQNLDFKKYALPECTTPISTYVKRYSSRIGRESYDRLLISNNVEYYEFRKGMNGRIREYLLTKPYNYKIMVLTSEQIDECLIDRDVVKQLDSLPKPERAYTKSKTSSVKTFVFSPTSYSYYNDIDPTNWSETTIDVGTDEIVYVEINRWKPVNEGVYTNSCFQIHSSLDAVKEFGIEPTVVGLKTAFLKTKQFKNGNFIRLYDYLCREVENLLNNSVVYTDNMKFKLITLLNCNIKTTTLADLANKVKKAHDSRKLLKIAQSLDIQVDNIDQDDTISGEVDQLFKDFPMLSVVSEETLKSVENVRIVRQYMEGV